MILLSVQWLYNALVKAFYWTLVHSLWQGLLAAALAGLIIAGSRRSTASIRYKLLVGVMFLFLAGSAITFYTQLQSNVNTPAASQVIPAAGNGVYVTEYNITPQQALPSSFTRKAVARFNAWYPFLVMIWAIFFAIRNVRLVAGLRYMHNVRRKQVTEPSNHWKNKMKYLSRRLGIHQSVQLLESGIVKVPVAIGYFRPVILIPLGMLANLPPDQAESILLHELAHTMRRDYLANLLQYAMEAIFFFNPAIRWVSAQIREEREACCDDIVMAHTTNTRAYLDALVSFHEFNGKGVALAMALGNKRMHLLNRVKRMLTHENKKLNPAEKLLLLLGLFAVILFGFIPRPETTKRHQNNVVHEIKKPVKASGINPVLRDDAVLSLIRPTLSSTPRKDLLQRFNLGAVKISDVKIDTVPQIISSKTGTLKNYDSLTFNSIKFHQSNEPGQKHESITAIDNSGNVYQVEKEEGFVKILTINGQQVPLDEINKHTPLLAKLDEAIMTAAENKRRANEERKEAIKQKQADNKARREEIEQQKERNRETTRKMDEDKRRIAREANDPSAPGKPKALKAPAVKVSPEEPALRKEDFKVEKKDFNYKKADVSIESSHEWKMENKWEIDTAEGKFQYHKTELFNKKEQRVSTGKPVKIADDNRATDKPVRLFDNSKKRNLFSDHNQDYKRQQQRVMDILKDLVREKIVSDIDDIEYVEFTDQSLVVNGNKVPDELHDRLKDKYGIRPRYGVFYGNCKTGGTGLIFSKEDLMR